MAAKKPDQTVEKTVLFGERLVFKGLKLWELNQLTTVTLSLTIPPKNHKISFNRQWVPRASRKARGNFEPGEKTKKYHSC